MSLERRPEQQNIPKQKIRLPLMAKPGIPAEEPQKRQVPDVPDPFEEPVPERTLPEPVRTPREPVPARR